MKRACGAARQPEVAWVPTETVRPRASKARCLEGERDSVDGYQQSSGRRVCVLGRVMKAGVCIIIVMFARESGLGIGCFGQAIA
jgi:hypothetical protein